MTGGPRGRSARLDDPERLPEEYATEHGLAGRASVYRWSDGPDPQSMAFEAVGEVSPRHVLEVGCGRSSLAERIARELGADVFPAVLGRERRVERPGAEQRATRLRRHFRGIERRDASGTVLFPDRTAAQSYVDTTCSMRGRAVPRFDGSLCVTRAPCVFVAEK